MGQVSEAADKLFSTVPNKAEILPFNNENGYGVIVRWGLAGIGFGELTFRVDKGTGAVTVDREAMGDETCGKIMDLLKESGTLVKTAEFVDVSQGLAVPTVAVNNAGS